MTFGKRLSLSSPIHDSCLDGSRYFASIKSGSLPLIWLLFTLECYVKKSFLTREACKRSLGCIISIIFTYLDAGYEGVNDFSTFREEQKAAKDMDRFFCSSTSFSRTQTNPAVKKWHAKLIRQAYTRSTIEGDVFKGVLEYLDKSVLVVNQGERRNASSAKDVASKLKYAYDHLRTLRSSAADDSEVGDITQQYLPPTPRARLRPFVNYFR